jgi:hypothetical protein
MQRELDETFKKPLAMANPRHDRRFARRVDQLVEDGAVSPQELEAELRKEFPLATVRERGLAGEPMRVWYAYRDGHWIDSRNEQRLLASRSRRAPQRRPGRR